MKIVIIGGGKVGESIASQLVKENHAITLIDNNYDVVNSIGDKLDILTVFGNGADLDIMRASGVEDADLLIACTPRDEFNLLCCVFAKKLGCKNNIARVRAPEYADRLYFFKDELGLSMSVNPELTAAKEIFKLLEIPSVLKRESFASGKINIIEVIPKTGDILDGCMLSKLPSSLRSKALICAVLRGEEAIIPRGDFIISSGDKVYICVPTSSLVDTLGIIGLNEKKAKNVMIIGASKVANYLVGMLLSAKTSIRIIDNNKENALAIAEKYPKAEVICADGTDESVLRAAHADKMDAIINLTNIDEENIILSMYFERAGVKQIFAKVDHSEFGIFLNLKDSVRIISPKKLCAEEVTTYVRAMQNTSGSSVITLHRLAEGKVDALEFNVNDGFRGIGIQLKNLRIKKDFLISSISRKGRVIIPTGSDALEKNDSVVVVVLSGKTVLDLNDILDDEA